MSKKILFFGNERLATGLGTTAPIFQALVEAGYDIGAVVIAQNKFSRSRKSRGIEISAVADKKGIPVISPADLAASHDELAAYGAEAAVLVAYGKIVPQAIIDIFPRGIVNIHPSLLPKHRGSTPIESVILNGENITGVSLMALSEKLDAGPIYDQQTLLLIGTETKRELAQKLTDIGKDMLLDKLAGILDGSLEPKPQDDSQATHDQLITKADGLIDWTKPASRLEREIRAYAEWPKSRAKLGTKEVIITKAHAAPVNTPGAKPGDIEALKEGVIMVECGKDSIRVDSLKPAGKKEMTAKAFLAGYKL